MRAFAWGLLVVSLTAQADIYRCQRGGQTVYTDKPCDKQSRPADLPPIMVYGDKPRSGVNAPEKKMARDWDRGVAENKKARDKADREWVKQQDAKQSQEDAVRSGLNARKVVKGMTQSHVREILGEPDAVRAQKGEGVEILVWSYKSAAGAKHTISFRDGLVNSVTRFAQSKAR